VLGSHLVKLASLLTTPGDVVGGLSPEETAGDSRHETAEEHGSRLVSTVDE